jgi:peptidoglycan hydrolase-like protein with peptidoglycan-binding domain
MLTVGSKGSDVTRLQRELAARGFNPGRADGDFGPNTRRAVEAYQRSQTLSDDGVVGRDTGGALFRSNDTKFWDGRSDFDTGTTDAGRVTSGRGWGGSEGVVDRAKAIARELGAPITSQKRNLADTRRVGSNTGSDHYTGNTNAFATDFAAAGARGDQLAGRIADAYGIPRSSLGTYNRHTVTAADGHRYSVQLLWRVAGHYNHVHVGVRRLD